MPATAPPTLGMILKGYPRISETFISNEILLLEQLGIPIRIFSMRHPRESFCHDSVRRIKARINYLPTELFLDFPRLLMPATFLALRNPARFLTALSKAGERFRRTRNLGTLKHLLQGAFLTNQFLRHSPEVVHLHAHFAHSPTSVALFTSILSGLDFSFTAHAKDIYTSNPKQLREKIDLASLVVTCTKHNKQYLQDIAGTNNTPIHCVYHGIDLDLFQHTEKKREPQEPYQILTVARLTAKKGIPTVIAALKQLEEKGIDFVYTLIGDGDDRDDIMQLIIDHGLRDKVRWLGTVPHDKVINEFSRTDLFVLGCNISKNGDRDGIPNVLVESLAMGTPAVGTEVSALGEIIHPEETGLLVKPENPTATAEAMLRLLTDTTLREQTGAGGKRLVSTTFDNRQLIQKLAAHYCAGIPALGCTELR